MSSEDLYDVVIVGGGIAGATIAKVVAAHGGYRILVLEAGPATGMSSSKYSSHVDAFQASLTKVPNTPYPPSPNAPQADVLDVRQVMEQPAPHEDPGSPIDASGCLVQTGPLPFRSDYTRALGGTTLHWLGTCLRMLPSDFKLRTIYGHGVDWPISYDDLRPYYERAETDILGVSGGTDDQHYPDIDPGEYFGAYEYPMHSIPASYLDETLAAGLAATEVTVSGCTRTVELSNTPAARNSTPRDGYEVVGAAGNPQMGQRCEGNTNCIPICPVQAKYSSLKTWYELHLLHPGDQPPSATTSSVTVLSQAVAARVEIGADGRVSGVVYQTYDDTAVAPSGPPRTVRGRIYVLAANAIQNATLLLASDAANSSGQVGRNLMDHPILLTWGLARDELWSYRGPLSTSGFEMFRDGPFRDQHCAFRIEIGNEGWNFAAGAPTSTVQALVDRRGLFGAELRAKIAEVIPRQFRLGFEMEQIPEATNYVTIHPSYTDQLGNPRPVIRYDLPDYVRAGMAAAKSLSDQMYRAIGLSPLAADENPDEFAYPRDYTRYDPTDPGYFTYAGTGYAFQGAGHLAGTHRMGADPQDSVVDVRQRCWDHDNLYLVGCGSMPTIGTSNPTLTMTAMAIMSAESIVADLGGPA